MKKYSGLGALAAAVAQAQQTGDGAQRSQAHQREDDAADGAGGTAEQPAHQVEAEQADEAPVQAAHDEQSNANFVKHPHGATKCLESVVRKERLRTARDGGKSCAFQGILKIVQGR